MTAAPYGEIVRRRRAFSWPGYLSYADAGLDGAWVTPYHLASASPSGPVLLTYNYLDAPTALLQCEHLRRTGYLPEMPFNKVLNLALVRLGLTRADLYVTHCFHLLAQSRSEALPLAAVDASFEAVARHELEGRVVIALGREARRQCTRHGMPHLPARHLSARGQSYSERATALAATLQEALRLLA